MVAMREGCADAFPLLEAASLKAVNSHVGDERPERANGDGRDDAYGGRVAAMVDDSGGGLEGPPPADSPGGGGSSEGGAPCNESLVLLPNGGDDRARSERREGEVGGECRSAWREGGDSVRERSLCVPGLRTRGSEFCRKCLSSCSDAIAMSASCSRILCLSCPRDSGRGATASAGFIEEVGRMCVCLATRLSTHDAGLDVVWYL